MKESLEAIQGDVQGAVDQYLPQKTGEIMNTVKSSSESINQSLLNIADLCSIESKSFVTKPKPTKVSKQLNQLWESMAPNTSKECQQGSLYIQKHMPQTIMVDSDRINQIISNLVNFLVSNAKGSKLECKVEWLKNRSIDSSCYAPHTHHLKEEDDRKSDESAHRSLGEINDSFEEDQDTIETAENIEEDVGKGVLRISVGASGVDIDQEKIRFIINKNPKFVETSLKTRPEFKLYLARRVCEMMTGGLKVHESSNGVVFVACVPTGIISEPEEPRGLRGLSDIFRNQEA
jgi:hypothetical protein